MKSWFYLWTVATCLMLFVQCQPSNEAPTEAIEQEIGLADSLAASIAAQVVEASGGTKAWQEAKVLQWNFFGRRVHTWDKQAGVDHIKYLDGSLEILIDLSRQNGRVWLKGKEQSAPDSLQKYLDLGNRLWINDSYWLFLPFKLRDTGTQLTYLGSDTVAFERPLEKLQLVFVDSVGVTPENKYHVFVDPQTTLLAGWSYFQNQTDTIPQFTLPWTDYKTYGPLVLAEGRGKYQITEIGYLESWPTALPRLD